PPLPLGIHATPTRLPRIRPRTDSSDRIFCRGQQNHPVRFPYPIACTPIDRKRFWADLTPPPVVSSLSSSRYRAEGRCTRKQEVGASLSLCVWCVVPTPLCFSWTRLIPFSGLAISSVAP